VSTVSDLCSKECSKLELPTFVEGNGTRIAHKTFCCCFASFLGLVRSLPAIQVVRTDDCSGGRTGFFQPG
jgi:hypothetical protein